MTPEERRARIAEKVRHNRTATIEELALAFDVTEQTIRRDVNALCESGILRRRHGGVSLPPQIERSGNDNIPYSNRQALNNAEKQSIARLVAAQIPNEASIYLATGTTPALIAKELVHHKRLRVFTHNLNAAVALCDNPLIEITMPGGTVRNRYADLSGRDVQDFYGTYNVDIGIFGVGGINDNGALLDFSVEEVTLRQTITLHSRKSFLVADHSKFGRNAIVTGSMIEDVDHFFTDVPPPHYIQQRLTVGNVQVHIASQHIADIYTMTAGVSS